MICGALRACQIFLVLGLVVLACLDFWPLELGKPRPRRSVPLEEFETRTTSTFLQLPLETTAAAVWRSPFKVPDEVPPLTEFAPVFVEEVLMSRKDLRICELQQLNLTVDDPTKAVFYLVFGGPVQRFLDLPPRSPERPYLCYDCDAKLQLSSFAQARCLGAQHQCDLQLARLLARRDFMFSSSDLRGWHLMNDSALLVPGVTHVHHIPAPEKLKKNKVKPLDPPKYFLTFQGIRNNGLAGASYARSNLEASLNASLSPPPELRFSDGRTRPVPPPIEVPKDVYIAIADKAKRHKELRPYFSLFDSAYGLVLHGHGRWSYRLMETLSGEAIPVILADGWQLPLDELIHWDQISLFRAEKLACDPAALIDSLPRDPMAIRRMREKIREVFAKFMETQEKRLLALLRSAALWKRNWRELEKGTLRMLADAALATSSSPG